MSHITEPTSTQNAEHYVWGQVCEGWHLLKEQDLSVIQERVPPGAGEAKHFHSKARQYFFVLSGSAKLEFLNQEISFQQGQGVHVPPGVVHRFVNMSNTEVHFLVISAPTTRGDRTNV
jgi:mannose-6-phosphate isomerase-like protein (cupin superfamily)